MKPVREKWSSNESASALICALSTIAILSIVGAGVLMNCTTRYNATSTQVKGWKEALLAAESGGEMGFKVLRANVADPSAAFGSAAGWASPAPSPLPSGTSWSLGYDPASPVTFGPESRYRARVTVDRFQLLPGSTTVGYYRIRSIGTAQLTGLKRVGMDNRLNVITKGDNLLRKIDFNFQHFKAAYGDGDALPSAAATAANGKDILAVSNPGKPEVSRRIEMVAVPIMPVEGAVKTAGRLRASGATFDSYDGRSGYKGPNPASPYDVDARDADMVCGSSDFDATYIYGDIATNGGAARTNQASGVVDNNVVTILPPATSGIAPIPDLGGVTLETAGIQSASVITPPTRRNSSGTLQTTFWYRYSQVDDLTINPLTAPNGTPIDTYVNIHVTGDVRGLTINKGVTARLYFTGNMDGKARDYQNLNADGSLVQWDYFYTSAANRTAATGFTAADVGKVAFQEGNTYWRLTNHSPATWAAQSVANASDAVCTPITPSWAYNDAAARTSAAGLANTDVGKLGYQRDTQSYYRLAGTSPVTWVPAEPYTASPLVSRAGHSWFYGITPADNSVRTIDIAPPGDSNSFYGGIYAPGHDFTTRGNPDFYGCFVVKSFYTNGNNSFHFDKQLAAGTDPLDYRLASYIEDIR
ncbi:MAG TPA: hypothetical protein VF683_02725 [Chthoniobacterales bacterium]